MHDSGGIGSVNLLIVEDLLQDAHEGIHVEIAESQGLVGLAHAVTLVLLGTLQEHGDVRRAVREHEVVVEFGEPRTQPRVVEEPPRQVVDDTPDDTLTAQPCVQRHLDLSSCLVASVHATRATLTPYPGCRPTLGVTTSLGRSRIMRTRRTRLPLALMTAGALLLSGCIASEPEFLPVPSGQPRSPTPESSNGAGDQRGALRPSGEPVSVVSGLAAPWSVVPLPVGSTLVSERDTARILERTPAGDVRVVGTVPGVVPVGEGGLLGLAAHDDGTAYLYAYFTTATDNRIVRFELVGEPGSYALGASDDVLTGIPRSRTHNGGRLAFGPDGMLYATTGDAGRPALSQDAGSLAGKILRLTPTGDVPDDNPIAGSLVYTLGHRNPQGIAFDASGQLWAAEFGQNTWDELNRITPGANYGWPEVEGTGGGSGFVDPVQQWSTSEASPSGMGIVGDTLVLASLRGQRLWLVDIDDPSRSTDVYVGDYGRLRDALAAPDGTLWFVTNNTDGRGSPRVGDDHLYSVPLLPRE